MKIFVILLAWIVTNAAYVVYAATTAAPPEKVVSEFFAYLAASDYTTVAGPNNHIVRQPEIGSDLAAQEKWLSRDLRESLQKANKYIRRHRPKIEDIPIREFDSGSVRFGWDPPGKFVIDHTTKATVTAIVAGRFIWGPKQQYAGCVRDGYFILTFEDNAWRISDIQADPYKFNQSKDSLMQTLSYYK